MRKLNALVVIVAATFATGAFAQMKANAGPHKGPQRLQRPEQIPLDQAKRIGRAEAMKLAASGRAVFIDVRSRASYENAHIPGAISLPQSQLGARWSTLPPGKVLIPYCACHVEETAAMAVLYFNAHGIKNTAALAGGWTAWKAAGLPVESSGGH